MGCNRGSKYACSTADARLGDARLEDAEVVLEVVVDVHTVFDALLAEIFRVDTHTNGMRINQKHVGLLVLKSLPLPL